MSVRVRFAPSPTGYLHIGGARTAMYCYLFAKANGGDFVLRIEDTDLGRSKKEYEDEMIKDLHWCGLDYSEGPDKNGSFGPYRQSERLDLYKDLAWQLVEEGKAYPCFLTATELEELTQKATAQNLAPHLYHDKYRDLPLTQAKERIEKGEEYVIRFKNPKKVYQFNDIVRGDVSFPEDMVGDFVIIRSNGMPVYNFCCVVDDWKMQMSHVIRAEEHLNNTVRQLMLYEAFGVQPPLFAHCSLLVGHDRQKLSKRHGATSVKQYREDGFLPQALMNYLCLLGWSHPDEQDIFNLEEIVSLFDLTRFNKAPALYDVEKLKHFNAEHIKRLDEKSLKNYLPSKLHQDHPFHKMDDEWKKTCLEFFKEKVSLPGELEGELEVIFSSEVEESEEMKEILSWDTTRTMAVYIQERLSKEESGSSELFSEISSHLKKELKIKGKPLFKGLRALLTGRAEGPDVSVLFQLIPFSTLKSRLVRFYQPL